MSASTSSSFAHQQPTASFMATASSKRSVVTSPPWARDEPPSPTENDQQNYFSTISSHPPRPSVSTSLKSPSSERPSTPSTAPLPHGDNEGPSWWMFARRGRDDAPPRLRLPTRPAGIWPIVMPMPKTPARLARMTERSRTWLSSRRHSFGSDGEQDHEQEQAEEDPMSAVTDESHRHPGQSRWDMHIPLPSSNNPFTVAHTKTPGWDQPWSPRLPDTITSRLQANGSGLRSVDVEEDARKEEPDPFKGRSRAYRRRKKFRAFMLNNTYVPLLFRVINATLTTAALAVAIRIRLIEKRYSVLGAVGSSPTLVIIFAPLTLVHVMAAIYLEYFGRPLGLWRTSMKLAHTLSETLFICAWSAALSLCFDNFFTAIIGCAPPSSISWYNQIQRPIPDLPIGRSSNEGGPADVLCDDQLALICLVGVGLIMYCTNLIISLFRIFEKVKYHPAALPR